MSMTTPLSADQLLHLPTGMGQRYELVAGELRVMSPSGWRHGEVVDNLHTILGSYIRAKDLGRGFGAETGFLIARNPDTVRAPDYAFIAKAHLPEQKPVEAFWPGAPDLAVEVLSPSDRMGDIDKKIAEWISAGCAAVWVVDAEIETVTIYRDSSEVQIFGSSQILMGDPVVPGFSCRVDELFR